MTTQYRPSSPQFASMRLHCSKNWIAILRMADTKSTCCLIIRVCDRLQLALNDVSLRRSTVSGVGGIASQFPVHIANGRYQR